MKIIRLFSTVLLLTLIKSISLYSAISVSYTDFISTNAPRISVVLSATEDGNPLPLTSRNVLFVEEGVRTAHPYNVTDIGDNKYRVEWLSALQEYPAYFPQLPDNTDQRFIQVIAVGTNDVARTLIRYDNPALPQISIRERSSGLMIEELSFNAKNRLQISLVSGKNSPYINEDAMLDSITFSSPYFSYNWQGYELDMKSRPPMRLRNGAYYLVDIFYNPPNDSAFRGEMLLHYNNGMVKSLALIAGKFEVAQTSLLQLIQPNGSEKLTPCQQYEIKWKGHSKDEPVIIELSTNNGLTWQEITSVKSDSYLWYVPNLPSDNALVRVRQEFKKEDSRRLNDDWSNISKIAFNSNGALAIAANESGKVAEYDIYNSTNPINFYYAVPANNNRNIQNIGVEYIKDDAEIVYFFQEGFNPVKMAYFRKGQQTPYKTIDMNDGFVPSRVLIDPQRRYIALQPRFSRQVQFIAPDDGSLIGYLSFNMPVVGVSLNKSGDSVAVVELDGNISLIKLNNVIDSKTEKSIQMDYLPIFANIKFSPNGKLLALSVVRTDNSTTESYLYDINRNQIVRTYRPAVGTANSIDFSPSSSSLIIGSDNLEQLVMYDLTGSDTKSILAGHLKQMNEMKLSPDGFAILSCSEGQDNLIHRSFSYPELDASNSTFRIIPGILSYTAPILPDMIIGSENTFIYKAEFCNNGEVPLLIYEVKFQDGVHTKLLSSPMGDTLFPGNCKEISFEITPQDTGNLEDFLIFASCQTQFKVPIKFRALNRNIALLRPTGYDMGESCVAERVFVEFDVFRNNDSLPIMINTISVKDAYTSQFRIESQLKDTLINPGEILKVRFSYQPKILGNEESVFYINHSNQTNVYYTCRILGKGIGTFLDVSHKRLMFIDEIDTRSLTIKNTGETDLVISEIALSPVGFFEILSQLPMSIVGGASADIQIRRIQKSSTPVMLNMTAKPCLVSGGISLESYIGSSLLELPSISADPRGRATIDVKFTNSENSPYYGKRYIIGEFSINPRLFLPEEIQSDYGESTLLGNQIVGDKRVVTFRVDGDFNNLTGTLCSISGVAGLAETASSPIEWNKASAFWGKSVSTNAKNGVFTLTNVCEGRLILQNNTGSIIQSINPSPAVDEVTVIIEAKNDEIAHIEILDFMGQVVFEMKTISLKVGLNEIKLNIQYLSNGQYSVLLRSDNNFYLKKIIISR